MLKVLSCLFAFFTLTACVATKTQPPTIELDRLHPFGATKVAFSADGRWLATGGFDGDIEIREISANQVVREVSLHQRSIRGLVWVDADTIASLSEDGDLKLWQVSDGEVIAQRAIRGARTLAFLRMANQLVVAGEYIHLLDMPALEGRFGRQLEGDALSLVVDQERKRIFVSTDQQKVFVFNAELETINKLDTMGKAIWSLGVTHDGKKLIGGAWFKLLIWDLVTEELEVRETEHMGKIIAVGQSVDGRHLASLGRISDSAVRVTDIDTGEVIRRLDKHELCGWDLEYSPDGRYLVTSGEEGSVHIYDLREPYRPRIQPKPVR